MYFLHISNLNKRSKKSKTRRRLFLQVYRNSRFVANLGLFEYSTGICMINFEQVYFFLRRGLALNNKINLRFFHFISTAFSGFKFFRSYWNFPFSHGSRFYQIRKKNIINFYKNC